MKPTEIEDLYLRSLDDTLSDPDKQQLLQALHGNPGLAQDVSQYKDIREAMIRKKPATFGPYFAQKVITRIEGLRIEIDKQIVFFFKKYQLAVAGVFIALLAVNVMTADQLNVSSVLGVQDSVANNTGAITNLKDSTSTDDDFVSFDFIDNLTNN